MTAIPPAQNTADVTKQAKAEQVTSCDGGEFWRAVAAGHNVTVVYAQLAKRGVDHDRAKAAAERLEALAGRMAELHDEINLYATRLINATNSIADHAGESGGVRLA